MTTPASRGYSDQPTTRDELGFAPSAAALLRIVHSSDLADTPLTIGIFGPWGSGKISLILKQLTQEWIVDAGLRLIVFVDDLDRCLPEQAIGVLEAIKVFLDIRGCIFVLGVDREIVERGIRVRYKEFALDAAAAARAGQPVAVFPVAGRDYLEKIVQVPFELPPLERAAIERFLQGRLGGVEGLEARDASRVAAIMTAGLLRNPRKVKRTFNSFRLLLALGQAHQRPMQPALIAKLVVIQSSFAEVYEQLARRPAALRELERQARDLGGDLGDPLKQAIKAHPLLKDMLYQEPFFDQLDDEQLSDLVFQTRTTHSAS